VDVSIDKDDKDAYKISSTNTITLQMDQETSFANTPIALVSSLSYPFSIDRSSLAFWNDKRKVSDLGIEDMPIPVRFKIPISKKLKRSFRFVSGGSDNNQGPAEKEPDFVAADSYYIAYAKLENGKDLSVTLADDTSKLDDRVIKLYYGLSNLYNNNNNNDNDDDQKKQIKKSHYDILSYTMNTATKMTALAKPNRIVIGQSVYEILDDQQKSNFEVLSISPDAWSYLSNNTGIISRLYSNLEGEIIDWYNDDNLVRKFQNSVLC